MNKFELGLLYKNETGNSIPQLSQKFTYDDEKSSILASIQDIEISIDGLSNVKINRLEEEIMDLKNKVKELNEIILELNTDIDISLDENSKDYVQWLETKIK